MTSVPGVYDSMYFKVLFGIDLLSDCMRIRMVFEILCARAATDCL